MGLAARPGDIGLIWYYRQMDWLFFNPSIGAISCRLCKKRASCITSLHGIVLSNLLGNRVLPQADKQW